MRQGKYLGLNLPDYTDAADVQKLVENFEKLEERAPGWTNLSNSGTVLETGGSFQVAPLFPVGDAGIFAITLKMPRAFVEGDVVMVEDTAYNLYQGTDPALNDAWKAGEVVTINFDKISRRCWASAGGGAPRPLPAQVSNMQASTPEGETPSIIFTWTNPSDENFAGMVLIVKEGSAPNSVTDGVQVYKGTGTTFTYTEGVQWEHTYFARGFAYNSQNKFQLDATGAIASATPSDVPNPVSGLKLEGNKGNATLTWTNPTQQSLQEVRVIQKIDSAPANPNDGTQVYSGTGISCTVSNLQDSIHYYFAVYAIAKNGKYKEPAVKDYIPEIYPKYSYTGNHTLVKDENNHWRIKFLSSGVLTWLGEDTELDVFVAGAGGGGGADGQGGCGGFTKTYTKVSIKKNDRITVTCGAAGNGGYGTSTNTTMIGGKGGTSSFGDNYTALGGDGGPYRNYSGSHGTWNGGTGGGVGAFTMPNTTSYKNAGSGGSDGADGGNAEKWNTRDKTYESYPGGKGQGSNTREFGDPSAAIYCGAGGGSAWGGTDNKGGTAGAGGQGEGPVASAGTNSLSRGKPGRGGNGYGAGGGGGTDTGGVGTQGIVIIRDARESA